MELSFSPPSPESQLGMHARAGNCSRALMQQGSPSAATRYASLALTCLFCRGSASPGSQNKHLQLHPRPSTFGSPCWPAELHSELHSALSLAQGASRALPPLCFPLNSPLTTPCTDTPQRSPLAVYVCKTTRLLAPRGAGPRAHWACLHCRDSPRPGSQTSCSAQELPCRCSQLCGAAPGALHNHWRP